MERRAEHAVLVCYDNGALAYASETTIEEMSDLMSLETACLTAYDSAAKIYHAAISSRCPISLKTDEYDNNVLKIRQQRECGALSGLVAPQECDRAPVVFVSRGMAQFNDKGVMFRTDTLSCISRVPDVKLKEGSL
jgi:hypothetical protein